MASGHELCGEMNIHSEQTYRYDDDDDAYRDRTLCCANEKQQS